MDKYSLEDYISIINENLNKYLNLLDRNSIQKNIINAMEYSLEAGGKRIRPVLTLEFCRLCGGDIYSAIAPACGLEMIHTFSLIHDDLPAMDNDDFRRGKPSCHKAFDEATAILAGDALSVYPFEMIANDERLSSEAKVKIISELAYSVGVNGMIGGQVIDMENEKSSSVDEENLRKMYALKTGALIKSACRMGCFAANSTLEKLNIATEYAHCLGLAFQIIDDILDVTSTQEVLGKPIGSDVAQNKTTFVTLFGLDKSREESQRLTQRALELLENFDDNSFLIKLTNKLLNRQN